MAAADAHQYLPRDGHGLAHDPFNAIVGPRPIGWISTVDAEGRRNLAPYSFFNAFNYTPPIVGFASTGWKDTVANIQATGVFCWNLATRDLAAAMNVTSAPAAPGQDEFDLAGLTPVASSLIAAPRVLESPVNFECRLTQSFKLTTAAGDEVETWMTFGEVVAVHIDRRLIRADGVYDAPAGEPILRWGGRGDYIAVEPAAMFELLRPTKADIPPLV
ncbi:flavin reductase family protein [Caulobacter hibisci]|uniref:Flavin reductase family protein n=1 Tax=Caulobacter hibisci TaxID=2035993 RepID=A0ABS0T3I5_9CAUL|nr:flavin reductase family protein [Caulobacter hibisci]MBI1686438.1 flavin reductase family protein [Caulobacter hibisci]